MLERAWTTCKSPILPQAIHPPPPNVDQNRLSSELSGADLGLILGGRCMGGGSTGLYEPSPGKLWNPRSLQPNIYVKPDTCHLTVEARKLEHGHPATPHQILQESPHNSSHIYVPTYWSLLYMAYWLSVVTLMENCCGNNGERSSIPCSITMNININFVLF